MSALPNAEQERRDQNLRNYRMSCRMSQVDDQIRSIDCTIKILQEKREQLQKESNSLKQKVSFCGGA